MTKEKLVEILKKILKTDADLNFLLQIKQAELEFLIACVRDRIQ